MAQSRSGGSRGGSKSPAAAKAKPASSARLRSSAAKAKSSASKPKSATAKSSASKAKSSAAARGSGQKSAAAKSAGTRKAAAKKGGQARARQQKARKAASGTAKTAARAPRGAGVEAKTVAEFRDALRKNLITPMEMVMLSRDRIEEVLGEAVDQGRVTVRDAQRITSGLVKRGEKQTKDVLKDLEQLVGRSRGEIEGRTSGAAKQARGRATRAASPALAQVDRARRTAGVGASFPITGYDDLNAAQVQGRLSGLKPPELRKVRDHERRNANRKTILKAIESKLS